MQASAFSEIESIFSQLRTLRVHIPVCNVLHTGGVMATNLALDPALLERAVKVSGALSKKAAVTLALQEFIARREQRHVAELFGKFDWDDGFDYKAERSRE